MPQYSSNGVGADNLFLLEVLVKDLRYYYSSINIDRLLLNSLLETRVLVKFLNYPPLEIRQDMTVPDLDYNSPDVAMGTGKSCLFSLNRQSIMCNRKFNIIFSVIRMYPPGSRTKCLSMGKAVADISKNFLPLMKKSCCSSSPITKSVKESYPLLNDQCQTIGCLTVFLRLSCFGTQITTKFMMSSQDRESYVFKGEDDRENLNLPSECFIIDCTKDADSFEYNICDDQDNYAEGVKAPWRQLSSPNVQIPQVKISQMQMPQMQLPQMQIPQMTGPPMQMPQMQMPQMQMSQMPQMQIPPMQMSQMRMSQMQTPQMQAPQMQAPQMQTPQMQIPQMMPPMQIPYQDWALNIGTYPVSPMYNPYFKDPSPGGQRRTASPTYGGGYDDKYQYGKPWAEKENFCNNSSPPICPPCPPSRPPCPPPIRQPCPPITFPRPPDLTGIRGLDPKLPSIEPKKSSKSKTKKGKNVIDDAIDSGLPSFPKDFPFCQRVTIGDVESESNDETQVPEGPKLNLCDCDFPTPPGLLDPCPPPPPKPKKKKKTCPLDLQPGDYCLRSDCPCGLPMVPWMVDVNADKDKDGGNYDDEKGKKKKYGQSRKYDQEDTPISGGESGKFNMAPGSVGMKGKQIIFQMNDKEIPLTEADKKFIAETQYKIGTIGDKKGPKTAVQISPGQLDRLDTNVDKDRDVFILKIGKRNELNKKAKMQIELRTPKFEDPTPVKVDAETQWLDDDIPHDTISIKSKKKGKGKKGKGKKGKGKKGKGKKGKGKKGKKGKKK